MLHLFRGEKKTRQTHQQPSYAVWCEKNPKGLLNHPIWHHLDPSLIPQHVWSHLMIPLPPASKENNKCVLCLFKWAY